MEEDLIIKREILLELVSLVKAGTVKSFQVDSTVYDFQNIKKFNIEENMSKVITLSNKYIPELSRNFDLNQILIITGKQVKDINILNSEGKFISLNVTFHSMQQLLKRFIYIYTINQDKFEFGYVMNSLYKKYFDYCMNLVITTDINEVKKDETLISLTTELLRLSKTFTKKNSGRHRDHWNFDLRQQIHDNTVMHFIHPFLFIIEDGFIKTIELYSSSIDTHGMNKFTSNSKKYREHVLKSLGI